MTVLDEFLHAQRDYRKAVKKAYEELYVEGTADYERSLILQDFVEEEKEKMLILQDFVEDKKEEIEEEFEELKEEVSEYVPPTEISIESQFELDYASPTWKELEAKRPHDYFEAHCPDWKSLEKSKLAQTIFDYFDVETVNERLPVADFVLRKLGNTSFEETL
jgi:hypothetical protein